MFVSEAVFVTVNRVSSFTVCVAMFDNTGAMFTSLTITVKVLVAVKIGLIRSKVSVLVTIVVIRFVLGLCACAGVHVMIPLALITMLLGGPTNA